jgi:hypothetical protein
MDVVLDRTSLALERIASILEAQLILQESGLATQREMLKLSQDAIKKQAALEETLQAELKRQRMNDSSWFTAKPFNT